MDKVYRVYQKGEDPKSGKVVEAIQVKSIIVEPEKDQINGAGTVPVRGAAYAGEAGIGAQPLLGEFYYIEKALAPLVTSSATMQAPRKYTEFAKIAWLPRQSS